MISAQELPRPEPDADQIRGRAEDILSRAEFNNSESVLERVSGWLSDFLGSLFDALGSRGVGSVVGWLLLGGLLLGVGWLLTRTPWSVGARAEPDRAQVRTVGDLDLTLTSSQWRAEADRLSAEGHYDDALRARYRALVSDLVAGGLLVDLAGRTPGEYRSELAVALPQQADRFADATDQFERAWYGPVDTTARDLARFIETEHAVLSGAGL